MTNLNLEAFNKNMAKHNITTQEVAVSQKGFKSFEADIKGLKYQWVFNSKGELFVGKILNGKYPKTLIIK